MAKPVRGAQDSNAPTTADDKALEICPGKQAAESWHEFAKEMRRDPGDLLVAIVMGAYRGFLSVLAEQHEEELAMTSRGHLVRR